MFSGETIRNISDHAAYQAAQEARTPLFIWGPQDLHGLPFLGSYVPAGWVEAEDPEPVLVDSSGFGSPGELALTFSQLEDHVKAHPGFGWAILESGQFQVVIGAFTQDSEAQGTEAPEPDPCTECGTIHSDIEECDQWCVSHQADHYPWDCEEDA